MIFNTPDMSEENWKKKYLTSPGPYLCNNCNKTQIVKKEYPYLKPCKTCGCERFWGERGY